MWHKLFYLHSIADTHVNPIDPLLSQTRGGPHAPRPGDSTYVYQTCPCKHWGMQNCSPEKYTSSHTLALKLELKKLVPMCVGPYGGFPDLLCNPRSNIFLRFIMANSAESLVFCGPHNGGHYNQRTIHLSSFPSWNIGTTFRACIWNNNCMYMWYMCFLNQWFYFNY